MIAPRLDLTNENGTDYVSMDNISSLSRFNASVTTNPNDPEMDGSVPAIEDTTIVNGVEGVWNGLESAAVGTNYPDAGCTPNLGIDLQSHDDNEFALRNHSEAPRLEPVETSLGAGSPVPFCVSDLIMDFHYFDKDEFADLRYINTYEAEPVEMDFMVKSVNGQIDMYLTIAQGPDFDPYELPLFETRDLSDDISLDDTTRRCFGVLIFSQAKDPRAFSEFSL